MGIAALSLLRLLTVANTRLKLKLGRCVYPLRRERRRLLRCASARLFVFQKGCVTGESSPSAPFVFAQEFGSFANRNVYRNLFPQQLALWFQRALRGIALRELAEEPCKRG